jgi:hypothetical protein
LRLGIFGRRDQGNFDVSGSTQNEKQVVSDCAHHYPNEIFLFCNENASSCISLCNRQYYRLFMQSAWRTTMETKRCAACGQEFEPNSHSPRQAYCPDAACQRARKRRWHKEKLQTDPDYVDNQARAQQAWCSRHADYWSNYRGKHPNYVEQNREKQHDRNAENRGKVIAKMDASNERNSAPDLHSGLYQINSVPVSVIAKMDVWTVEIRVLSHLSKPHR